MQSFTVNLAPVTIPANTPGRTYWIGVIYDNGQDASNTNNDTDGWDAALITVAAGSVDLLVASVSAPSREAPGSGIVVSTVIQNAGPGAAAAFIVDVYLSPDSTCTTADTFLGTYGVAGLDAGASDSEATTDLLPQRGCAGAERRGKNDDADQTQQQPPTCRFHGVSHSDAGRWQQRPSQYNRTLQLNQCGGRERCTPHALGLSSNRYGKVVTGR